MASGDEKGGGCSERLVPAELQWCLLNCWFRKVRAPVSDFELDEAWCEANVHVCARGTRSVSPCATIAGLPGECDDWSVLLRRLTFCVFLPLRSTIRGCPDPSRRQTCALLVCACLDQTCEGKQSTIKLLQSVMRSLREVEWNSNSCCVPTFPFCIVECGRLSFRLESL